MEVAAQAENGRWTYALPQKIQGARQEFAIVMVTIIGVRRGDNVLNAIGSRHAAHFFGHVPGFGAVIYFGEDVAVNVDHA